MTEHDVAPDRRARKQWAFRALAIPIIFLFIAPCVLFLLRSSDFVVPRIRIEYGPRAPSYSAPANYQPTSPSPPPPPPASSSSGSHEQQQRRLPPPRQLTDEPYSLGPSVTDYDSRRAQWLRDHPQFPATIAQGRPRVLVVTGSSPRRCSDPEGDHVLLRSFKNKADYCRIHGFDIFYSTAVLDAELTGFWTKLPLLRTLMLAHPETEFLWWMDSDVVFTDMLFEPPWSKYSRHNLVLPGWDDKVYDAKSWLSINAGSFIIRNSQWSLDLLHAWAVMGPRGPVRFEYGKRFAEALSDRKPYESDDQSALVYLLVTQRDRWGHKTFLESAYSLHGYWADIVDRYEYLRRNGKPGGAAASGGGEVWPLVTHFVGCKPCGGDDGTYEPQRCQRGMERALNFGDDQILKLYGFEHESLNTTAVRRARIDTGGGPLDADDEELAHLLHPSFRAAEHR
ncbi:hypothetical protein PR202_ga25982 [Eleusine coracana subsp. coracana]|uniref:Uncharacterized protein n=1 Tax=Eleusine coracana subsp. coracana TaxID=191504 RepID=A0AAV5DD06_ELECO|nr:hypothetical protein QOZ80_3AG0245360 [Eleusine coracana subsp. coracana]GJN08093.1 hypothetical protein PR202_ga25982 [Eleusine coracana subsp. coracana]